MNDTENDTASVIPPASLEGWYALHQVVTQDWDALRAMSDADRARTVDEARALFADLAEPEGGGWSATFQLVAGGADWMFVHFRETLDDLARIELRMRRSGLWPSLRLEYDYVSVTEAALYYATAETAREAEPGSDEFRDLLAERAAAEGASPHVQRRLYPELPVQMRYVSFYPMTKRRNLDDNWYMLPVEERNRLMREHGLTGRRYAGRVSQIITGSIGLDDWEWGVTLFAHDMLDVKRIVTEMRYDEASSRYGEFGRFYTGIRVSPDDWAGMLAGG